MAHSKGRRGKYHEWISDEGLIKIEGWARDGLIDRQIAHNMGITEQTLNVWKKRFPSLSESLKKGKEVVDREVENALLKRALGYTTEEVKYESVYDSDKKKYVEMITERKVKEVIPDTTAQIFWLKNRQPISWRDKKEVDTNVTHKNNPFSDLTVDELKKLADVDE